MKLTKRLTKIMQQQTVLFFSIVLASCSSQYQVSTNLDKENFQQYFAPSSVEIFKSEQDFGSPYQFIGAVEGQDCQIKAHLAAPNEITARTHARTQAFEKKANAIIFTGCALIEDDKSSKQCINTLVCYGKAYFVSPRKQ
jgi:RcsF protein